MNIFFSLKSQDIKSKLTIAKFQNRDFMPFQNRLLYSAQILDGKWYIRQILCPEDENFFYIENYDCQNDKIFFISKKLKNYNENNFYYELKNYDIFTDTDPAYRANLQIFNKKGGFSSYQSEYPYLLATKNSSILSNLSMLTNKNADKNYLYFKNIYYLPLEEKRKGYLIDIKKKEVLYSFELQYNTTNIIELESKFLNKDTFFYSDNISGIPIFISEKSGHLSMEHTHPPHLYFLNKEKFQIINKIKKQFHECIY